jgi:hypothetical protein
MVRTPKMCKKKNMELAMVIGVSLMKEMEKNSFTKGAYTFRFPFGEFGVMVIREK